MDGTLEHVTSQGMRCYSIQVHAHSFQASSEIYNILQPGRTSHLAYTHAKREKSPQYANYCIKVGLNMWRKKGWSKRHQYRGSKKGDRKVWILEFYTMQCKWHVTARRARISCGNGESESPHNANVHWKCETHPLRMKTLAVWDERWSANTSVSASGITFSTHLPDSFIILHRKKKMRRLLLFLKFKIVRRPPLLQCVSDTSHLGLPRQLFVCRNTQGHVTLCQRIVNGYASISAFRQIPFR